MSHWPAATCRAIDWRDSDYGDLWPHTRCQACGRVIPDGMPRSRQSRVARGSGGRRGAVYASCANGVNLCGTATTPGGCHLLCEQRDEGMRRRGFWILANTRPAPNPLVIAVIRWNGMPAWATADGKWALELAA